MAGTKRIGILIFDQVEVLDFSGPFEVFSRAAETHDPPPFKVKTVAPVNPVRTRGGMTVVPDYLLEDAPPFSILIVPGGPGARLEMKNEKLLNWLRQRTAEAELLLSVCTGALLLAKAKLLEGLELTTHHLAFDELRALVPVGKIHQDRRYIDNGKVILSAGVSAGIDMSLYTVGKLLGPAVAEQVADRMEYKI